MIRVLAFYDRLRGSLWFIPTLIVALMAASAAALVETEGAVDRENLTARFPRLFGAGADASRELLTAIAGSMVTVAGVTFSITVVALTLASSQYSSRIVGNFMRDRATQTVLGVFLGIFGYCLIVLRTIRSGDEGKFVPSLAILVGLLLAFVAIGYLIFFIHHVAASIQASSIISSTAEATLVAIDRLFPEPVGEAAESGRLSQASQLSEVSWCPIRASRSGYVQGVDADSLFRAANEAGIVIRLELAIGEFVTEGAVIASTSAQVPEDARRRVEAAFTLGKQRTLQQDAGYGIRQIVDVALRALSPGVNDTTTAVHCVDYLGTILIRLVERQLPDPHRSDGERLRLIAPGPTFPALLGEAFDEIRRAAPGNVTILVRLLRVLQELSLHTRGAENARAIDRQLALVSDAAERDIPAHADKMVVLEARHRLRPAPGARPVT